MTELPQEFKEKMKKLLGAEYEEFLKSYDQPRNFGLRVNTQKISPEEFEKLAPFHLTRIPWVENGYYYEAQDAPARHPFYHAGLYYLQEPSAMTPASRLPVNPGDRVLDLCAAPGGKATELGAKLKGRGLLVANDISASRAKALLKNIEVFGIRNAFVTNAVPGRLAEQFPGFFDKVLVDAPCSGEGMFRKDPAVAKAWDEKKPEDCAKQQKEIISRAADMLVPGGLLLYSTCTFSAEENEQVIAYLLEKRQDMELIEIPGFEGFSAGFPEAAGYASNSDLKKCVRIFPHKMAGEGHFMALLQKKAPWGNKEELTESGRTESGRTEIGRTEAGDRAGLSDIRLSKGDRRALEAFFSNVFMEMDWNEAEIRSGQVYLVPKALGQRKGIPFLRNGLYLGEIKKDRFEPSQSLAMALRMDEYAFSLNLDWQDERILRYLKGETIDVTDLGAESAKGWQLVCVNGYPLGWGKLVNGLLKNKYHPGWRMSSAGR
ncbi:MAG: RsmB/NOP family class I SAM-dependent RNA methyltransferase [Eubacteriales bacterium]|nr:RsmB/NOP family class I SAM-dependent RNA methyltransferase [Eubacteriales bacterium]